eukprot:TRINITY_DN3932_c0_g5_i1.p1 TRINITY_DN3932_c0_g5~~TRINITY_DN3932_c0_g5_i1.p1  ORF type:complete len:502 (-),score=6.70 TRINITY_DN3932_c0_g5_i1:161-1666(-)
MWSTEKHVEIQDAGLQCVNVAGISFVVVYVVFYEMLYHGSHLESVPVTGAHEIHIRHPTVNYCDERKVANCHANLSLFESQPYCLESKLKYAGVKLECEHWTSHVAEAVDGDGASLTTMIRKYNATRTSFPSLRLNFSQDEYVFTLLKQFYLMDIERFWLKIEHSMTSAKEGLSSKSSLLTGYYRSCDSSSCPLQPMQPLPGDFGVPPASEGKQQPSPAASSPIPGKMGKISTNTSLLQSRALATRRTSSRVRNGALARKSHTFLVKTRTRSLRVAKEHAASSTGRVNALKTRGESTRGEPFVLLRPGRWSRKEVDVIPFQYLLDAVNVSLDDPYKKVTYRQRGLVLTITLRYVNTQADMFDFVGLRLFPWSESPLVTKLPWDPEGHTRARYVMSVRKNEQGYIFDENEGQLYTGDSYIQRRRNGIYIDVVQSGEILVWSWARLAIHVSAAVGLLRVTSRLTRFWAWACRDKALQNVIVERHVWSADSGRYERVERHDDLT